MVNKKKDEYVSGPYNIAHLRGNIDGIQKDIYILFDIHNPKDRETPCKDDVGGKDIIDFLTKKFKNTKEELDFMVEIHPSDLITNDWYASTMYIQKIWTFARDAFTTTDDKSTVIKSKKYPNVRTHYIDIRDVYFKLVWIYELNDVIYNNLTYEICEQNKNYDIPKEYIKFVFERLEEVVKVLLAPNANSVKKFNLLQFFSEKRPGSMHVDEKFNMLSYIVNKIKISVKNKQLNKCLNFIETEIQNYFSFIKNNIYNNIMKYNDIQTNEDHVKFSDMVFSFYDNVIVFSLFLMDAYAIKRIVEKDYIKKTILYVGGLHASHYIMLLVNFFDFKIIDISKNPENSIEKLTEKIRNNLDLFYVHNMFWDEKLRGQCSDSSPMSDIE
jgi:hypothetical protein